MDNQELSGYGDGGPLDYIARTDQRTVYSSTFKNFLNGKEYLHYAYAVLLNNGVIDSVSDAMPDDARAASDLKRSGPFDVSVSRKIQRRRLDSADPG